MNPETNKKKFKALNEFPALSSPVLKGIGAAFIGLLLGFIFAGSTFLQSGYIDDSFSNLLLIITLPLEFFIFYALKFKLAFMYPLLLLFSGEQLRETASIEWLQAVIGARLGTAVMIATIWFVLAVLIESLYKSVALSKFSKRKTIIYVVVAFLPLVLFIGFLSIGGELKEKRSIAAKSYSKPNLVGVEIRYVSDQANEVFYKDKNGKPVTIKGSGSEAKPYPKVEDLYIDTHTKSVFGENACTVAQPVGSKQTKNYEVREIPGENFKYGYAEFELNKSNPPHPKNAYKSFLYCFVVNNDRYLLQRDNYGTDTHLKLYPAEDIIKSVLGSKQEVK